MGPVEPESVECPAEPGGLIETMLGRSASLRRSLEQAARVAAHRDVIVLIGGLRSRPGVATAAFFFGVTPRFFTFLKGWELIIAPAIVMFTLVRHPGGLGQTFGELRGMRTRKVATREDDDEAETASASLVLPRPALPSGHGSGENRAASFRMQFRSNIHPLDFVTKADNLTNDDDGGWFDRIHFMHDVFEPGSTAVLNKVGAS